MQQSYIFQYIKPPFLQQYILNADKDTNGIDLIVTHFQKYEPN